VATGSKLKPTITAIYKSLPALILLAIEDVTDREYYKRDLEELVKKRTAELIVAKEEAEERKQIAETASCGFLRQKKFQANGQSH